MGEAAMEKAGEQALAGDVVILGGGLVGMTLAIGLAKQGLSLTFVPVADHAHHDPHELADRFGGRAAASLVEALGRVPEPRLVAGSLYLAGEVLALNHELPD